jgi:hypothetical protein
MVVRSPSRSNHHNTPGIIDALKNVRNQLGLLPSSARGWPYAFVLRNEKRRDGWLRGGVYRGSRRRWNDCESPQTRKVMTTNPAEARADPKKEREQREDLRDVSGHFAGMFSWLTGQSLENSAVRIPL